MRASIARSLDDKEGSGIDGLFDAAAELHVSGLAIQKQRGKIVITGVARYHLDRELLFEAVKQLDSWESDVVLEVEIERHDVRGYHTVQPGETLASIAEQHLGSASRDMEIFDANRDRMNDPDQISPGQQLLIPWR